MTAQVTIRLHDVLDGLDTSIEVEIEDFNVRVALNQAVEHAKAQAQGVIEGSKAWARSEAKPVTCGCDRDEDGPVEARVSWWGRDQERREEAQHR